VEANTQAIATLVHQVVANPQAIAILTQRVEADAAGNQAILVGG